MKEKIAYYSRRLFDKHGFHGAALRDVCRLSGCKMPTIYYYYGSKEKLFDEVTRVAFEELEARLWEQLPKKAGIKEHDIQMVIQKKHLSEDERTIYRLAQKTWLGFGDCEESRRKLTEWEEDNLKNSLKKYRSITSSSMWAKFIARSVSAMIQRIILLEEKIPDKEIREEIGMIFEVVSNSHKNGPKERQQSRN